MTSKKIRFVDLYDFSQDYMVFKNKDRKLEYYMNILINYGIVDEDYLPEVVYSFDFDYDHNFMISTKNMNIAQINKCYKELKKKHDIYLKNDYIYEV